MGAEIEIDLSAVGEVFEVVAGKLLRRATGEIVTAKFARYTFEDISGRLTTNRIIYSLTHNKSIFGHLLTDDDGVLVEVPRSIHLMMAYASYTKVNKTQWSIKGHKDRIMARWFALDGTRKSKCFNTEDEAIAHQKYMVELIWKDTLLKYNLWNTYCNP